MGDIQPVVFLPGDDAADFWTGLFGDPHQECQAFYRVLGKSAEDVFPITYQVEPGLVIAEIPAGTIPGFLKGGAEAFLKGVLGGSLDYIN